MGGGKLIAAPGGVRRDERGVTLLELLVVMTILALMAGVVVVNGPQARSSAEEEATRFAARMRAAWEDALVSGAVLSFEMAQHGYAVRRYAGGEWKPDSSPGRFAERDLPSGVQMTVTLQDPARENIVARPAGARDEPQRILVDPVGLTTPFDIEFADRRARWRVRNLSDETIVLERRDPR